MTDQKGTSHEAALAFIWATVADQESQALEEADRRAIRVVIAAAAKGDELSIFQFNPDLPEAKLEYTRALNDVHKEQERQLHNAAVFLAHRRLVGKAARRELNR